MRPCKICDKRGCRAHCYDTPDGKHVPNPQTIEPGDGPPWSLSVRCAACGINANALLDPSILKWE